MLKSSVLAACLACGATALFPDCTSGPLASNAVCNTSASVRDRAQGLVTALTLAEKFNLTGHQSPAIPRLGLPAYGWWQEALVSTQRAEMPHQNHTYTLIARRGGIARSDFQREWD